MSGPAREQALRYLGHRGQPLPDALSEKLDRAIARCQAFAQPRRTWVVSDDPALQLPGARRTAALAVTLGHGLAREIGAQQHRDMALAAMLDAAATALVESVADGAEAEIGAWAAGEGLHPCPRVSPGYGNLPLSLHGPILRALGAERAIGLTLTDRLILVPAKSVTALVGLHREPVAGAVGCAACQMREGCQYGR